MARDIPLTRNRVSDRRASAIRDAVKTTHLLIDDTSRLARSEDAKALLDFLSDPGVHAPIYSLPRPLTKAAVAAFIQDHIAQRDAGTGLLFVRTAADGAIIGYSDFQIWPQWAAGELGGALHPNRQNQGEGGRGALATFGWMFEALDLDLICETSALDNVRTARMLERIGFHNVGEITSQRPDGTARPSAVWEMTRAQWLARQG